MEATSVKRLSALTKTPLMRHNSSFNKSTLVEPEIGNDDFERSKRRSIVETNKRNINLPSTSTDSPTVNVGDQEVKQHLEICLKMFAENKISVKNAWNLKIIDYLKPMVKSNKFGNNALQVGSTSLDVSTKVYSIRVDDVHSEGLQLASNMARMTKTKNVDEDDEQQDDAEGVDGEGQNPGDVEKQKQKKKKRQRKNNEIKHTIAKDENSLVCEVSKIESATFQTRSNSDWSVIDNFFTNKLPMDLSGCKFMFLNNARAWESTDDNDETIVLDKKFPYNAENIEKKFEICKEFLKFEVDKWDPDTDELKEDSTLLHQSELIFDDKGIPMAELDGSIQDIFHQPDYIYHSSDEEAEECVGQIALRGDVVPIYDLKPIDEDTCMSNDYLYHTNVGNKFLSQIWAGPSHWKLKHLHRNAGKFSGQNTEKIVKNPNKRKLKDDPYEPIAFLDHINCDVEGPNNMRTNLKGCYHPITDISTITLPCNHIMKAPITLLSKPRAYIDRDKMNRVINDEKIIKSELKSDDDKLNTSNDIYNEHDYCVNIANDEDEGFEAEVCEEENIVCENQNFGCDNLIDKPEIVPETYLTYATKAKKVDMKKLKYKIWHLITNGPDKDEILNSKFSEVYEKLPALLSNTMKEELSSSLAFIAFLHLANEQNLKLTGNSDMSDFEIEKDLTK